MNTYIALLRGINVGGKNVLPMKHLVTVFEELGFTGISTYIQSGNVVFQCKTKCSDKTVEEMATTIQTKYGFKPHIILLQLSALESALDNNPYKKNEGKTVHFYFLAAHPVEVNLDRLAQLRSATEDYEMSDAVFYLYAPDGIGRSKLAAAVEECMGVSVTARNLNTVNKLVTMAQG